MNADYYRPMKWRAGYWHDYLKNWNVHNGKTIYVLFQLMTQWCMFCRPQCIIAAEFYWCLWHKPKQQITLLCAQTCFMMDKMTRWSSLFSNHDSLRYEKHGSCISYRGEKSYLEWVYNSKMIIYQYQTLAQIALSSNTTVLERSDAVINDTRNKSFLIHNNNRHS